MPNYFARANGNINATNVWATTPTGTPAAQTFVSGDVLYANNFAITVNVSTNLGSTGGVRNDNTNSATTGGQFTLSNGVTLTANVIQGATATACVTYSGTTGNSATIVGDCTGGSSAVAHAVTNTSSGTLNINGNVNGGTSDPANGARNNSTGTINITGNCTGGTLNACHAVFNSSTGTINVTGTCTGGGPSSGTANAVHNAAAGIVNITGNCIGGAGSGGSVNCGAENSSIGTINITGNCTGGAGTSGSNFGARNNSTGILSITGNCTGSSAATSFGAVNNSTGQMSVNGSIFATETAAGVGGGSRGQVTRLTGPFYTSPTFGVNPNTCLAWRWASTLNPNTFIEVPTTNLVGTRNLVTPDNATNFPATSNVRSGVTYGIGGALTGTCAVPPASSVRSGVPVDNTVGTAALTAANLWDYALSSASSVAGSVGEKLKKTAIPADIIALG